MLFITNPSHIRLFPFLKSFQFSKVDEESQNTHMRLFFKELNSVCCFSWIWSRSMALVASSFSALSFSIFCSDSRLRVARVAWSSATFSDRSQSCGDTSNQFNAIKIYPYIFCDSDPSECVDIGQGRAQKEIIHRFIIPEIN